VSRSGIKRNKYKALIVDSRRDRVKELFVKGYSREEISNTIRISQPTVSRDLQYINDRSRKKIDARSIDDTASHYYMTLLGLDQLTKNLWKIIDNPKTKVYEKLKAIKQLEE
jgi:predicted transcriptional regulator